MADLSNTVCRWC